MKLEQLKWSDAEGWNLLSHTKLQEHPQLVLAFGSRKVLSVPERFRELRDRYPSSHILSCSTSGEIIGTKVHDDTIISTAVFFEKTTVKVAQTSIHNESSASTAGRCLANKLASDDLVHLFIISDGQDVNGSELVKGLGEHSSKKIPITGGLAGDGSEFKKTLVGLDDQPREGNIAAVGFYGAHLKVGHGSMGGWDPFGPERIVTKSERNVLYELDDQSALQLYKKYLGPRSNELPSSALLFPLSIHVPESTEVLVRTVLSINEENQSMTFAGDVPLGAKVQLMKANFDRLIDGATTAADNSLKGLSSFKPELAILISCVGRRLVLSHRSEEEVEEAMKVLGSETVITGFYSYGEISPLLSSARCELHNQTMTITTYREE